MGLESARRQGRIGGRPPKLRSQQPAEMLPVRAYLIVVSVGDIGLLVFTKRKRHLVECMFGQEIAGLEKGYKLSAGPLC